MEPYAFPGVFQAPLTKPELGTYLQEKGFIYFWLYQVTSVRLSGILTESQILASGIQLMSDIIYFLIVLQPLTQITLSFTLTFTESRMNINGGIHPVPDLLLVLEWTICVALIYYSTIK